MDQESTQVADGMVVVLTFVVVSLENDEVLDDRWSKEHYAFIQGRKQMPRGFEEGIEGLKADDRFEFDVSSEKAYGERNPKLVQKVERDQLPPNLNPGMVVQMEVPGLEGIAPPLIFHVADVGESIVKLDGNHPFAGKDLRFMGRIRRVRAATEEEMRTGRIARDA